MISFKKRLFLLTTILFYCLPLYSQTFTGNEKDIHIILNNIDDFSASYMNKDFDQLANAYAEDARILPPGTDIIEGREAIKKRWILPDDVDIPLHKITPTEIKILGDYAYDIGYYHGQSKRPNGDVFDFKGKYVIVWKKEDGDWKIYLDIWNDVAD